MLFGFGDFLGNPAAFLQRWPGALDIEMPFDQLKLNEWHHLKLEAKGKEFTFWVNGKKALEHRENELKAGAVGLGLANYIARFDNVEISGPDVPDVTPPTWKARPVQPRDKLSTFWGKVKVGK